VKIRRAILLALTVGLAACAHSNDSTEQSGSAIYTGTCSPSSAAWVGTDMFVVGDDDGRQLRIYHRDKPGPPLRVFDLMGPLQLDRRGSKTDIEGAARIGERVYWVSSHGRSSGGKEHPNRWRFFATEFEVQRGLVQTRLVGRPYRNLLRDLTAAPELSTLDLLSASRLPAKAPGGLNIEGLSATPENHLLIGFRNPVPDGKALLIPLLNPDELLAGRAARFGPPIRLDLAGLGIRDMIFWEGQYLIVAGPAEGRGRSRLYSWAGGESKPRRIREVDLKGLNPEAIVVYPDRGFADVQLLSDDSSRKIDGVACDDLEPKARQFRSIRAALELQ
jgi:hypothetical protein